MRNKGAQRKNKVVKAKSFFDQSEIYLIATLLKKFELPIAVKEDYPHRVFLSLRAMVNIYQGFDDLFKSYCRRAISFQDTPCNDSAISSLQLIYAQKLDPIWQEIDKNLSAILAILADYKNNCIFYIDAETGDNIFHLLARVAIPSAYIQQFFRNDFLERCFVKDLLFSANKNGESAYKLLLSCVPRPTLDQQLLLKERGYRKDIGWLPNSWSRVKTYAQVADVFHNVSKSNHLHALLLFMNVNKLYSIRELMEKFASVAAIATFKMIGFSYKYIDHVSPFVESRNFADFNELEALFLPYLQDFSAQTYAEFAKIMTAEGKLDFPGDKHLKQEKIGEVYDRCHLSLLADVKNFLQSRLGINSDFQKKFVFCKIDPERNEIFYANFYTYFLERVLDCFQKAGLSLASPSIGRVSNSLAGELQFKADNLAFLLLDLSRKYQFNMQINPDLDDAAYDAVLSCFNILFSHLSSTDLTELLAQTDQAGRGIMTTALLNANDNFLHNLLVKLGDIDLAPAMQAKISPLFKLAKEFNHQRLKFYFSSELSLISSEGKLQIMGRGGRILDPLNYCLSQITDDNYFGNMRHNIVKTLLCLKSNLKSYDKDVSLAILKENNMFATSLPSLLDLDVSVAPKDNSQITSQDRQNREEIKAPKDALKQKSFADILAKHSLKSIEKNISKITQGVRI